MSEDGCSSARPAFGFNRRGTDDGDEQEGRDVTTQQEQEGVEDIRLPVCFQDRNGRTKARAAEVQRALRDEIPGRSRKGPVLRGIAPLGPLGLQCVAVHDADPLRIPPAGRPAEPDGVALDA